MLAFAPRQLRGDVPQSIKAPAGRAAGVFLYLDDVEARLEPLDDEEPIREDLADADYCDFLGVPDCNTSLDKLRGNQAVSIFD